VADFLLVNWKDLDDGDKYDSLETINQSAKDLIILLENLINWVKLNKGNLQASYSAFKLNEFVETELALHKTVIFLKDLTVQVNIPEDVKIKSDPVLLQLIIHNILANAFKFSYKNSKIQIDYEQMPDGWMLSVEDEGKGMDEEELALMLAAEANSAPGTFNEKGTGVGTSLTIALVKEMGGSLHVKSQQGTGTRVSISFPNN
jgi:signal transduction histidine kinase